MSVEIVRIDVVAENRVTPRDHTVYQAFIFFKGNDGIIRRYSSEGSTSILAVQNSLERVTSYAKFWGVA